MNPRLVSSHELTKRLPVSSTRAVGELAIGQLSHCAFAAPISIATRFTPHRA